MLYSLRNFLGQKKTYLALICALFLFNVFLAGRLFSGWSDDLAHRPAFSPHNNVIDSEAILYLFRKSTFDGGRWTLGKKNRADFTRIEAPGLGKIQDIRFDFKLAYDADTRLSVEYGANHDTSSGIVLAQNGASFAFSKGKDWLFTAKSPLPQIHIGTDSWHKARIRLGEDKSLIKIDNNSPIPVPASPEGTKTLIFGTNVYFAQIDNLKIGDSQGRVFSEDFSRKPWHAFLGRAVILVAVLFTLFLLAALLQSGGKQQFFVLAGCLLVTVIALPSLEFILYGYFSGDIARREIAPYRYAKFLFDRSGHPRTNCLHPKTMPYATTVDREALDSLGDRTRDMVKIVFLGGSQTFGTYDNVPWRESFVDEVQRLLRARYSNVLCINLAQDGATSGAMVDEYDRFIRGHNAYMAIMNTGINDREFNDTRTYRKNLVNFTQMSRKIKTIPILSVEPSSPEAIKNYDAFPQVMTDAAKEGNAALWDTNAFIGQNIDRGFCFYDWVHLSRAGRKLTAKFLYEKIQAALDADREIQKKLRPANYRL